MRGETSKRKEKHKQNKLQTKKTDMAQKKRPSK